MLRLRSLLLLAAIAPVSAPLRYLALGDSYTIGEGVAERDRWPVQLARTLRAAGVDVADPEIIARTGWTTDELDRAITEQKPAGTYALVTLLIGVNNEYRGMNITQYRADVHALLARSAGFAAGDAKRVIVVSIPDWGVTPFNTARSAATVAAEIDAFNTAAREETVGAGAHWVDVTDLTRADPRAVMADGLHPNPAMYTRWVERIAAVARTVLARP